MNKIWANRLLAGSKAWEDVPEHRRNDVKAELEARLEAGIITEEDFAKATAE